MAGSYPAIEGLPEGVELSDKVLVEQYVELIQYVYVEHKEIDKGRASNQPSISNKKGMAELLNSLGFFSPRYEKLLPMKAKMYYEIPTNDNEEQLYQ